MAFLVLIHDHPDAESRRQAFRQVHLELQKPLVDLGLLIIGGALLDDDGRVIGSAAVLDFDSVAEVEEWFHQDPYFRGNVWRSIDILPFRIADSLFKEN